MFRALATTHAAFSIDGTPVRKDTGTGTVSIRSSVAGTGTLT